MKFSDDRPTDILNQDDKKFLSELLLIQKIRTKESRLSLKDSKEYFEKKFTDLGIKSKDFLLENSNEKEDHINFIISSLSNWGIVEDMLIRENVVGV